jgi:hypothetical protein
VEQLLLALSLLLAFTTPALPRTWPDYQIIEWQPATPAELATLKRIGVTTGMVSDPKDAGPLKQARLHYYVENIATDFYSAYHRWSPTAWIGARFAALQERYAADPADRASRIPFGCTGSRTGSRGSSIPRRPTIRFITISATKPASPT